MSNEGTHAREQYHLNGRRFGSRAQELWMGQGQTTGISTSNRSLGGTSSGLISNSVYPTASLGKRLRSELEFDAGKTVVNNNALHQEERPSTLPPNFVGKVERDFQAPEQPNLLSIPQNTLQPEQFYQNTLQPEQFSQNTLQAEHFYQNTLQHEQFSQNTLHAEQFYQNTLQPEQFSQNTLQAEQVYQNTLQLEQFSQNTIQAEQFYQNILQLEQFSQNTIQAKQVYQNTLQPEQFSQNTLQAEQFYQNTFQPEQFSQNTLQAEQVYQSTLQPEQFSQNTLQAEQFYQNTLQREQFYQVGNVEMGPNNECSLPDQDNVTRLGNGNYHLPIPNFTAQLHGESPSSVQLPPFPESCLQNPFGTANGAPPTSEWTSNPNLQQLQYSELPIGMGVTQEMMQSRRLSRFSPGGRSFNNETQQQQEPMGSIHHRIPKREMGDSSSSRNVKMKMTLPNNSQQFTQLHAGSFTQGNGNTQPQRLTGNSLYDPMFEKMGLPVDPHLRMFLLCRQEA